MAIFQFGAGVLLGQRTDIANATPLNFGLVQEVQLDLSFTTKELYGQNQFPVAIGRGTGKMTGKAKMAQVSGLAMASLFMGVTPAAGYTTTAFGEQQAVPSNSVTAPTTSPTAAGSKILTLGAVLGGTIEIGAPVGDATTHGVIPAGTYVAAFSGSTVTMNNAATGSGVNSGDVIGFGNPVPPANQANFVDDWGVIYAATGLPLTKQLAGTALTQGQYYVSSNGYYYFSTADDGAVVLLSYSYNVSTAGQKLSLASGLIGTTPTFSARLFTTFQGRTVDVYLYNCVSSKLAVATKLEDFAIPELDFSVFANAAGNVLDWSFSEAS